MGANVTRFSPSQDVLIRAGYVTNLAVAAIVAACQAIETGGRTLTPEKVMNRARKLHVQRPDGWRHASVLRAAATKRAKPGGDTRNVARAAVPQPVPLQELVRIGRGLGLRGDACLDAERVTRAARAVDRAHPGYRLMSLGGTTRAPREAGP